MRCALINTSTSQVENLIVADPSIDNAPDGYILVATPPDFVVIGTEWNGSDFIAPVSGVETL